MFLYKGELEQLNFFSLCFQLQNYNGVSQGSIVSPLLFIIQKCRIGLSRDDLVQEVS